MNGQNISFVRTSYAQAGECAWADILLSVHPVDKGHCAAEVVVDKFDTWRNGAHAIWAMCQDVRVKHVAESSAKRPWSAYRFRD